MIVFDASTLILLARIDLIEIFISTYGGRIVIPDKVKAEILKGGKEETPLIDRLLPKGLDTHFAPVLRSGCVRKAGKIEVLKISDRKAATRLENDFSIDAGEAEALVLAIEHKAALVATDDRNAIRSCKVLKIDFTTAVAFLVRSFEKKLIDKKDALYRLGKLESIARYKKTILDDAAQRIRGG